MNIRDSLEIKLIEKSKSNKEIILSSIDMLIDDYEDTLWDDIANNLIINILIKKNINNSIVSLYSLASFKKYLDELTWLEVLENYNNQICNLNVNHYQLQDKLNDESVRFVSNSFSISTSDAFEVGKENVSRKDILANYRRYVRHNDLQNINLIPNDFHNQIDETSETEFILEKIFIKLKQISSIMFLVDHTTEIKDNSITIEVLTPTSELTDIVFVNGSSFEEDHDFAFNIYDWVYSGKIFDKLVVVRTYIKVLGNDTLELNEEVFSASQFAYKKSLEVDLRKQIDTQNITINTLNEYREKNKVLTDRCVKAIKDNSFTVLAFFISNFLIKKINTNLSSELKTAGIIVLLIFFLYLVTVWIQTILELNKIKKNYYEIINLLREQYIPELVRRVLSDKFIEDERDYVFNYMIITTIIWIIELSVLFIYILLM